jgi:hypothetical protein
LIAEHKQNVPALPGHLQERTLSAIVLIRHWLRVDDAGLGGMPHRLIVDDDQLQKVVTYLECQGSSDVSQNHGIQV